MKNKIIIIAIILILILGVGIFFFMNNQKEENSGDALKFKEEYESLNGTKREKDGKTIRTIKIDKDNPMVYKDASEIVKMINNKETFVVYFGFADCPWCRSILPTLIKVAKDLELDKIYYVDVKEIRDVLELDENGKIKTTTKGSDAYYELLKQLDNVLADYTLMDAEENKIETGEKRIYAPNVVTVVDGKAKKLESGISDKQTDGYMKLTDEISKDMYNKLKNTLKIIVDKDTCSLEGC